MRLAALTVSLIVSSLSACTWVKIEPEAKQVRVAMPTEDLSACGTMRSEITVSVRDQVGLFNRDDMKVRDELETLARNQAAGSGVDTMKALNEPLNGEQTFGTWLCGRTVTAPSAASRPSAPSSPDRQPANGQQGGGFQDVETYPVDDEG
ncbi:MAG: DUF4156 domain-containing protein [Lysobacteraceae bacterium]